MPRAIPVFQHTLNDGHHLVYLGSVFSDDSLQIVQNRFVQNRFVQNRFVQNTGHCYVHCVTQNVSFISHITTDLNTIISTIGNAVCFILSLKDTLGSHEYELLEQSLPHFTQCDFHLENSSLNQCKSMICKEFRSPQAKPIHELITFKHIILKIPFNRSETFQNEDLEHILKNWTLDADSPWIRKSNVSSSRFKENQLKVFTSENTSQTLVDLEKWYSTHFSKELGKDHAQYLAIYFKNGHTLIICLHEDSYYLFIPQDEARNLRKVFPTSSSSGEFLRKLSQINYYAGFRDLHIDPDCDIRFNQCQVYYDAYLAVPDLHLAINFEQNKWLKNFFYCPYIQSQSSSNRDINMWIYRPYYQTNQSDGHIQIQFQQMFQKNCIRMNIKLNGIETWQTVQDVIEVLYYLMNSKRLLNAEHGKLNYKDLDPYLYKTAIQKGGFTRQCTDYMDKRFDPPFKRFKVSRMLITKHDFELYEKIPENQRRYILYYRGNHYAAIDDYIHNSSVIERINQKNPAKQELYLNTVVLFPPHEKYRKNVDSDEELFYPCCVRAKSGMPMLKHQFILKRLLDQNEIDLIGGNAEEVKKNLAKNVKLQRTDVVYYISCLGFKLKGFATFGTLPVLVEKLLAMSQSPVVSKLIRKASLKGFLHAIMDVCVDRYRKGTIADKNTMEQQYKTDIIKRSLTINSSQNPLQHWIGFGSSSLTLFTADLLDHHQFGADLASLYFQVNVFVLIMKNSTTLDHIYRNTLIIPGKPVIFLLYWDQKNGGYETVFCHVNVQKTGNSKELEKSQFLWVDQEMMKFLNNIFKKTTPHAITLSNSFALARKLSPHLRAMKQILNLENQTICLTCELPQSKESFVIPIHSSPPLPNLPVEKYYQKHDLQTSLHFTQNMLAKIDPNYTLKRYILSDTKSLNQNNCTVIALELISGLIMPIQPTVIQSSDNHVPFIFQQFVPYVEGITHYKVREVSVEDARTKHFAMEAQKKHAYKLLLSKFHQYLQKKQALHAQWDSIVAQFGTPKFKNLLYNLFYTFCESRAAQFQQRNNLNIDLFREIFIEGFYYLLRHPEFPKKTLSELGMQNTEREKHGAIVSVSNIEDLKELFL